MRTGIIIHLLICHPNFFRQLKARFLSRSKPYHLSFLCWRSRKCCNDYSRGLKVWSFGTMASLYPSCADKLLMMQRKSCFTSHSLGLTNTPCNGGHSSDICIQVASNTWGLIGLPTVYCRLAKLSHFCNPTNWVNQPTSSNHFCKVQWKLD